MKLDNSLRNRLEKSEWWFLERLDYVGARLIVEVVEGCVSSITEDVSIDGAGVIADVRPVEVTELSKRLRIEFVNVLAYQVIDESYYGVPSSGELEEATGPILCQQTGSDYLEYLRQSSLIMDLIDDSLHHYILNLADDIVDVITTSGPTVDLI